MKKIRNSLLAISLVVLGIAGLVGPTVFAASAAGNGMRISPVRTDLVLKPGSSKTISVYVRNVTSATATYSVVTNDFVASDDESGSPALLLNGEKDDQHGLKQFMHTNISSVTVKPDQQKEVKVSITIPKGTAGGGYYGAVRFIPGTGNGAGPSVSLAGSVASLVLVRVPGNVIEKTSIVSFDARKGQAPNDTPRLIFTSNKDIYATARFQNEGNIQEQPFGKILLKKGSKTLATFSINSGDQPGNVLPNSIRKFQVKLNHIGSFGKYKLEGNFGYGSNGQLLSASTTFYVVPVWAMLLAAVAVLIVLFFIFVFPKMVRRYNRGVIRKASRRR